MKNRNIQLDLIRVLSMILVIGVHVNRKPFEDTSVWRVILTSFLLMCNGIFYMLSGELHLQKRFVTLKDYKDYYVKKLYSIMIPYIVVTCILSIIQMYQSGEVITIFSYIKYTYTSFMIGNSATHLWFMYPLIGILLCVPFLTKMLEGMKREELDILFMISIIWNVISIFFTINIGVGFAYSGWIFSGWIIYFFAGYYREIVINKFNKSKLYLAGIICFVITVLGRWLILDNFKNATDLASTYLVVVMAAYTFLKEEVVINNAVIQTIIFYLAKHSFIIYMIHDAVLKNIVQNIVSFQSRTLYFICCIAMTLVISLFFSVIIDVCILSSIKKVLGKCLL